MYSFEAGDLARLSRNQTFDLDWRVDSSGALPSLYDLYEYLRECSGYVSRLRMSLNWSGVKIPAIYHSWCCWRDLSHGASL